MDARTELKLTKKKLDFEIKRFMELTDIEESRKSSNKIKELAIEVVNLRKEINGKKKKR